VEKPDTHENSTQYRLADGYSVYLPARISTAVNLLLLTIIVNTSENTFTRLVSGKTRFIRKGETLFHQDDAVVSVYVVKRGRIKLIRNTEDGNPVVLQLAMAGDVIAEASLFSNLYHCSAVADSPTAELTCFNRHALLAALKGSPAAAMDIMELFAHRIRKLRTLLEIRNIRSARQRIHAWLRLEANGGHEIALNMTYKDVAYQLGLAHETFYRALKQLEEDGRLTREKGIVRLR